MFLQTTHGEDIWSSPFHVGGAAEYDSTSWRSVQPAGHRHTNLLYYTGDERVLMLHALPEGARQSEELHRRHAFHRECSKLKQLREDEWVLDEERKRSEGEEDAGD